MKPQVTSSLPSPLGPLGKFRYSILYLWNRIGLSPLQRCVTTLLYKTACKCLVRSEVHPEYPRIHSCGSALAKSCYVLSANPHIPDIAEIPFSAVRSARFWVSGYWTKWRIQGSFDTVARVHARLTLKRSQETHYLASTLSDTFVKCICRSISCALGKWSFHSRWNLYRLLVSLHVHGDERWPTEVTSNTYFPGVPKPPK